MAGLSSTPPPPARQASAPQAEAASIVAALPQRSGVSGPPRGYLAAGDWPDGPLVDGAPPGAEYALHISRVLRDALADRSQTEVAEHAELARSTLHDIVHGRTWPDVVTLAKLEATLDVRLWPK